MSLFASSTCKLWVADVRAAKICQGMKARRVLIDQSRASTFGSLTNGWQLSVSITFFALITSCRTSSLAAALFEVCLGWENPDVGHWPEVRIKVSEEAGGACQCEWATGDREKRAHHFCFLIFLLSPLFRDIFPNLRFFMTILAAQAFLLPSWHLATIDLCFLTSGCTPYLLLQMPTPLSLVTILLGFPVAQLIS